MSASPAVAVVNLPSLAAAVADAGYSLLVDGSVDAATVAGACRREAATGREVVVVIASLDSRTAQWAAFQAGQGRKVLVVESADLPMGESAPDGVRVMRLPATLDELMGQFGAPPLGAPHGVRMVSSTGMVAPAVSGPVFDMYDPFADEGSFPEPDFGTEPESIPVVVEEFETQPPVAHVPSPAVVSPPVPVLGPPTPPVFPPVRRPVDPVSPRTPPRVVPAQPPAVSGFAPQPVAQVPVFQPAFEQLRVPQVPLCPVVFVVAAGGGVGKTTISLSLAQHAAEGGLQKVVMVDMNRGQGDVRKVLRVSDSQGFVPTIYDAAIAVSGSGRGNPAGAILRPALVNQHRPGGAPVRFGCVFAPRDRQSDPSVVTAAFYAAVIEAARRTAQLVVVDTQIVEAFDTSGLFDQVAVPLLASDQSAWSVALTGKSEPDVEVDSLINRWRAWADHGVTKSRTMFFHNRFNPGLVVDPLQPIIDRYAVILDPVPEDPAMRVVVGDLPNNSPGLGRTLDQILLRVTGLPIFGSGRFESRQPRGLFARLGGRK